MRNKFVGDGALILILKGDRKLAESIHVIKFTTHRSLVVRDMR
jgi:hypothetical protein